MTNSEAVRLLMNSQYYEQGYKQGVSDVLSKYRKEWFEEVMCEIKELARLHSTDVPMVHGDGEEIVDKMVSLEELGRILAEIEDAIGGKL